jgi:2Fe-2S ferredoxin
MPTMIVTLPDGSCRSVDGQAGLSAIEILRGGGIDEVLALCGGACSCASCHVYVDPGCADGLPEMSADERDLLDGSDHRRPTSRLACQIPMTPRLDGLRLTIAPED